MDLNIFNFYAETAAYYIQQAKDIEMKRITGPNMTIDLNNDFLVITDEVDS